MPGTTANLAANQPLIPSAASPQFPAAYPLSFDQMIMQGNASGVTFTPPTNYYPMNEASGTTVVDAMGVANGTYHGTLLYQQKLLIPDGKPVPFFLTANSNYATLNDPTASNIAWSAMAVWYAPGAQGGSNSIVSDYDGSQHGADIYVDTSNTLHSIMGAAGFNQSTPYAGTGLHISILTFNGTTFLHYLDGNIIAQTTTTYTKGTLGWGVGANANGANFFTGYIGKVGIWGSTALTQAQITAITQQFQNAGAITAIVNPYNNFDTIVTQALAGAPAPTNYYPMNEASGTTVVDAMGNANGTYHNSPTLAQRQIVNDGKPVPYFTLGSTQYAIINDPSTSATAFTRMIAFQMAAIESANGSILSDYNATTNYFRLEANTSQQLLYGINNTDATFTAGIGAGGWHLAFLVYDGANFKVYLDGVLYQTTVGSYTKQAAGVAVAANANASTPWSGFAGKCGMWASTALTQQQITNLTNAFFAPQGSQLNQNLQGATSTYPIGSVITAQPVKLVSGSTVTITLPTLPTGNWSLLAQAFWDAGAGTGTITGTGATWDFSGTVSYGNGTLGQTVGQLAGTAVGGQTPSSSYSNSVALSGTAGYYLTLVATRIS